MEINNDENPQIRANILSSLLFCWMRSLLALGNKRPLTSQDLYKVLPDDDSAKLGNELQKEWDKELRISKAKGTRPSLTRTLVRMFAYRFFVLDLLLLLDECILRIAQPLCLWQLIHYFEPDVRMPDLHAYLYASGLLFCSMCCIFTKHTPSFKSLHIGMKIRVACCSLIYKKCLLLSQASLDKTSIGHVTNLMSNDVRRFETIVFFLHFLWVAPIQTAITTIILYYAIGPTCFAGLIALILLAALQSSMSHFFSKLRLKTAQRTDSRAQTMNELISGIKTIKLFNWEIPFTKVIESYRKIEAKAIKSTAILWSLNVAVTCTSSKLMIFLVCIACVLSGVTLTPAQLFLTVSLFQNIRLGLTSHFVFAIATAAEAKISVKRMEDFLLLDEFHSVTGVKNKQPLQRRLPSDPAVYVNQMTVKWSTDAPTNNKESFRNQEYVLSNVSFTLQPGEFLAVTGPVGAGKSTLLKVILGEVKPLASETCQVEGKMAYAAQDPWIFNGTIRDNILCGYEYDSQKYKDVISACALEEDFVQLPLRDLSPVGEKGISLSGGQKARVSLARCLYMDADIYLLDDPLSAVDTRVGRHLFNHAINGFLSGKTRILVTHQLQHITDSDYILALEQSSVGAFYHSKEIRESETGVPVIELLNYVDDDVVILDEPSALLYSSIESQPQRQANGERASSLLDDEEIITGHTTLSTYRQYFQAGVSSFSLFLLACSFLITQLLYSGSDYWLSLWTDAESSKLLVPKAMIDTHTGISVYSGLVVGAFVFSAIRTFHFLFVCISSSVTLHNRMLHAVSRAPLHFFERTPVGRILNRFTKDIGCMDDQLPITFFDTVSLLLGTLSTGILSCIINYWLVIPTIGVSILFYKIRQFYMKPSVAIRRLEAKNKSPVFSHVSTSMIGLVTLRAHRCSATFQKLFDEAQNVHTSAYFLNISASRWLGIWLDWALFSYVVCVVIACVALRDVLHSSEAGLVISLAMSLAADFQFSIRQSTETENMMTSVERVIEYGQLSTEAQLESNDEAKPPPTWPAEGNIIFDGVSLSYGHPSEQPALKNIKCAIKPKERIGIVGRTGAGKSSLISALFRLVEPDGKILIDGVDTKNIGLGDLRSKISIIPQDPILFSGSMRKNLDPLEQYNDDVLWKSLKDVQLEESMIAGQPVGLLDFHVAEGGANLSIGQRQLVCLARSILRQNRILVLDEATANIDHKTEKLIQSAIRKNFSECTVLTIAHRLNTIMDSDKVMVMDAGCLAEFDAPSVLLMKTDSLFYLLVEQMGPGVAAELEKLVKQRTEGINNKHHDDEIDCWEQLNDSSSVLFSAFL